MTEISWSCCNAENKPIISSNAFEEHPKLMKNASRWVPKMFEAIRLHVPKFPPSSYLANVKSTIRESDKSHISVRVSMMISQWIILTGYTPRHTLFSQCPGWRRFGYCIGYFYASRVMMIRRWPVAITVAIVNARLLTPVKRSWLTGHAPFSVGICHKSICGRNRHRADPFAPWLPGNKLHYFWCTRPCSWCENFISFHSCQSNALSGRRAHQ